MTALNVYQFPARPDRLPPGVGHYTRTEDYPRNLCDQYHQYRITKGDLKLDVTNMRHDPHEQARQLTEAEAEWEAPMAENVPTLPETPLVSERAFYLIGAAMSFTTALCVALAAFGGVR